METATNNSAYAVVGASGRYKPISEVGCGFGGVVLKVRDVEDDSVVAVKVFAEWLQKNAAFRADLRLVVPRLAGVFHPNMVEVFRLWDNGDAFVSMDFVEGESLARVLDREGRLRPTQAIDISISIARVLDFARRSNLVHGSLKPSSVLVDATGTVRVEGVGLPAVGLPADVASGIANLAVGRTSPPTEEELSYYVGYERILECRANDPQADFYGIGMMLYHMLTGAPPVVGQNMNDALFKLRRMGWPSLSKVLPELPRELCRVVERLSGRAYSSYDKLIGDLLGTSGILRVAWASCPCSDRVTGWKPVPQAGLEACATVPSPEAGTLPEPSAIDRVCVSEGKDLPPPGIARRFESALGSITGYLRRPAVRRPLFFAAGIVVALLIAFFVMRPIYLSTLAPPLPQDAVRTMPSVPPEPLFGAVPAAAETGSRTIGCNPKDVEEAFAEACRFRDSFPDQFDLAIEKFGAIAAGSPGTKWESDAQSHISEIVAAREEAMTQEFKLLGQDASTLVEWEDFSAALAHYEAFLSAFPQTKFRDVIETDMERIKKNAATKVAVLAERANLYIERRLPDLAKVELERILELAVDKQSVASANEKLALVKTIADELVKEREETSRALAEQLKFRAFVEDELPAVSKELAAFNHDGARDLLTKAVAKLPQPRSEKIEAVVGALTLSLEADEKFVETVFKQVNEGTRVVYINQFLSKPVKGVVTKVDKTRLAFKFQGETATAGMRWSELHPQEVLKFFSLFRGLSIEQAFPFGCFCYHRGYKDDAVKFLRMAHGASESPGCRAAGVLLGLCE